MKRSTNGASVSTSVFAVQVPEYPGLPADAAARHAPVHPEGDFVADQTPRAIVLPLGSASVHVPVTFPVPGAGVAVQVPPTISPVLLVADQRFG